MVTTIKITIEDIKKLRDATGVSVMQCKKALEEAGGDMEKALMVLKKKSAGIASKKAGRETKAGLIVIKTSPNKAVMVVLSCETDFVAKNEDFIKLIDTMAEKVLAEGPEAVKESASEVINPVVQKIGENIQLGEITVIEGDNLGTYVHSGKVGVIVSLSGGSPEIARDVAMHIAAMKPEYIQKKDIDEKAKKMAKELFGKEVAELDKPEEMKEKILQGKIDAYFNNLTLLGQPFIKDEKKTIGQLLKDGDAEVKDFKRYSLV